MSIMYAQMGMSVIGAFASHSAQKHDYKMQKMTRRYMETMSAIAAASQLNTQTLNEIEMRDAGVRAGVSIEAASRRDKGALEVAAASAGIEGGSVVNSMRGLERSRLLARAARQDALEGQARQNTQQRRNIAMSRAMNKDVSPLVAPSAADALLGLGAAVIDIYDSHQPQGSRVADTLAGWAKRT